MSTTPKNETLDQSTKRVVIKRTKTGFGFNILGTKFQGGPVKCINGEFYEPLQEVSIIEKDGSAEKAGLSVGDRILKVNEHNVEGATHQQVVDLILENKNEVSLLVLVVDDDNQNTSFVLDTLQISKDEATLPITIPTYTLLEVHGEKFHVFNIHIAGRHLCSRRYREFVLLNDYLKINYPNVQLESLPKKWPFKLTGQQLDARRRDLEKYLDTINSIAYIRDCDYVQTFLSANTFQHYSIAVDVEIKIEVPDQSIVSLHIKNFTTSDKVYDMIRSKVGLPNEYARYFYLFEIVDDTFTRKLRPNEYPHDIYIQNCSLFNKTCLCLRKFCFSPIIENNILLSYPLTCSYVYHEAIRQFRKWNDLTIEKQSIIAKSDERSLIKYVQTFADLYNTINFPICSCSSRPNNGCVVVSLNSIKLSLYACLNDGKLEDDCVANFDWTHIQRFYIDDEYFIFEYKRSTMNREKSIKLKTEYSRFMYDCFDCIFKELK